MIIRNQSEKNIISQQEKKNKQECSCLRNMNRIKLNVGRSIMSFVQAKHNPQRKNKKKKKESTHRKKSVF